MAKDPIGVSVHMMNPVHRMGPVFYASLPCGTKPPEGQGTNGEEAKHRLLCILWDHFVKMDRPLRPFCHSSNRAAFPIQIVHDALGRPHLLLGEHRGPAISFSTAGEEVWAALCGDESDIGIDVAENAEFRDGYPMQRVFHASELHQALELAGGDLAGAAALLWSIKEAVAKALGCAFHLVDPRDIHVYPSAVEPGGPAFSVRLSGNARMRFPMADRAPITVHSLAQAGAWLSIAALIWPRQRAAQPNACEAGPLKSHPQ
jgi:phosphopantetheinyl transferase